MDIVSENNMINRIIFLMMTIDGGGGREGGSCGPTRIG